MFCWQIATSVLPSFSTDDAAEEEEHLISLRCEMTGKICSTALKQTKMSE